MVTEEASPVRCFPYGVTVAGSVGAVGTSAGWQVGVPRLYAHVCTPHLLAACEAQKRATEPCGYSYRRL